MRQYLKNSNYDLNAAVNRSVSFPFTHIRISLLLFPLHFVTAPALSKLVALAMAVPPPHPRWVPCLKRLPSRRRENGHVVGLAMDKEARPASTLHEIDGQTLGLGGVAGRGSVLEEEIGIATPCLI